MIPAWTRANACKINSQGSVDKNGDIRCVNRPKGFGISLVLANCLRCFLVDRCLTADFQSLMNPAVLMSAQGLRSKRLKWELPSRTDHEFCPVFRSLSVWICNEA